MSEFSVTLPGGKVWVPQFVGEINQDKCIGCGRCYKVCGREVLAMVGINEDGEIVKLASFGEDDDDEDEYDKKVMSIDNVANCVGCEACAKICPKQCYTHTAVAA